MNILITGALGHIGSKLIRYLPKRFKGSKFYLVDDLRTQRYMSLINLPKESQFKFYDEPISKKLIENIISKIDLVIHLAAITDAASSFGKSKKIKKNNYENTKLICDLCLSNKKKIIFISSTSVYGSSDKIMYEDDNNLNPQSPYADIKIREEKYIQKLTKKYNLQSLILRFGTIVGFSYGMRFHTAVNKFCYQASIDQPLTVWKTSLNQKRPYLGLNDACRSIEFLIKKNKFNGDKLNILSENLSVKRIIQIIKSRKKIRLKMVNNKIMNQLSYVVSTKKIEDLNFKFKDNLRKLILEELKYFDNINSV
tara:strand:- start:824 stop:1753 length:930 start_codon:yes stop_codon:yes gene_type:complete